MRFVGVWRKFSMHATCNMFCHLIIGQFASCSVVLPSKDTKKPSRNEIDVLQNKLFANKMVFAKTSTNQNQFAKNWRPCSTTAKCDAKMCQTKCLKRCTNAAKCDLWQTSPDEAMDERRGKRTYTLPIKMLFVGK